MAGSSSLALSGALQAYGSVQCMGVQEGVRRRKKTLRRSGWFELVLHVR